MTKTALTTTAFILCATCLSAEELTQLPDGDFHKIATTYSEEEQEFNVDVIPAKAFAWIKAIYAADFAAPAAHDLTPALVSQNTQHAEATN